MVIHVMKGLCLGVALLPRQLCGFEKDVAGFQAAAERKSRRKSGGTATGPHIWFCDCGWLFKVLMYILKKISVLQRTIFLFYVREKNIILC